MPDNTTAKSVNQLRQEVKELESITLIAIENLENELSEYSAENAIEIISIEKAGDSLSDSIKKIY